MILFAMSALLSLNFGVVGNDATSPFLLVTSAPIVVAERPLVRSPPAPAVNAIEYAEPAEVVMYGGRFRNRGIGTYSRNQWSRISGCQNGRCAP